MDIKVYTKDAKKAPARKIDDKAIAGEVNTALIRDMVGAYWKNRNKFTASTKTRGDIGYSGKKPFRQKGTGSARAGTRTSPIWRSGGVVFGPHPRTIKSSITKKMKTKAFQQVLSGKILSNEVILHESLGLEAPKTSTVNTLLKGMGIIGSRILFVTGDNTVYKSARNIDRVKVARAQDVNILDMLSNTYIVATQEDFDTLFNKIQG